ARRTRRADALGRTAAANRSRRDAGPGRPPRADHRRQPRGRRSRHDHGRRGRAVVTVPAPTAVDDPGAADGRTVASGARGASAARGTLLQRVRVVALRGLSWVACLLAERVAVALAEVVGWAWYKLAPARAAQARRNLARVVAALDARGQGSPRARAAAHDP